MIFTIFNMAIWTVIKIAHNVLAMKSSGIETLNYRMKIDLNRIINLTVSTDPAIFYSFCYAPFLKY
jgi:hypothetical protein